MGIFNGLGKFLYEKEVTKSSYNGLMPLNGSQFIGLDGQVYNKQQDDQKLIDDGYGSNVTVYSIINKLLTTSSSIPLIVWDEKTEEVIESGRVWEALQNPAVYRGEMLTTEAWLEVALSYLFSTGNLYQRKQFLLSGKVPDSLEIIPSGIICPIEPTSYLLPNSGFIVDDKQKQFKIESDELDHLKYVNPTTNGLNTLKGLSPLQAGLYSLTGSTDIQKALSVLVKNQGARGILTNKSNRNGGNVRLDPADAQRVKTQVNNSIRGIDKINSVHVTSAELDYLSMGMSASDLKLIESGVLTDRQLCNIWNVDSKLFNDPASSTFNNLNEATKGMYTNAILPSLKKVVGSFNKTISKPINMEANTSHIVKIDENSIEALQADQKLQAEKNKINADGINVVLNMPISNDSKVETLQHVYGMTEELANNIVGDETNTSTEG